MYYLFLFFFLFLFLGYGQGINNFNKISQEGSTIILYDFRKEKESKSLRLAVAEETNVLSCLFKKYLKKGERCKQIEENYDLGMDRETGQFIPEIHAKAEGSFTGSNKQETAYLIWLNECSACHADNFGTRRLAVFAGNELLLQEEVAEGDILKTVDLDEDGAEELLLAGNWIGQGQTFTFAQLVSLNGKKFNVIEDFKQVAYDDLGNSETNNTILASVIYYQKKNPSQMPIIQRQNYEAQCIDGEQSIFEATNKDIAE